MGNGAAKIGYAAMLEQFGPTEVVDYSVAAEQALMLQKEEKEKLKNFEDESEDQEMCDFVMIMGFNLVFEFICLLNVRLDHFSLFETLNNS